MLRHGFSRIAALVAVLMVAATLAGCGVNNIPTYEQSAKAKWSEVLNQYKRRSDLIPNLVETVKGFAEVVFHLERGRLQYHRPGFDLGEIENVLEHPQKKIRRDLDRIQRLALVVGERLLAEAIDADRP